MKNYIIPYGKRSTRTSHGYKHSLMVVDGVGLYVYHGDEKPTKKQVRNTLIGWNDQKQCWIQANSFEEALENFYDLEAAKTGTKYKAIEIVDSEHNPVIEYPSCDHMRESHGSIACAYYDEPTDTSCMVCILDGLDDPPGICPIMKAQDHIGYRSEKIMIGGVWLERYTNTVKSMKEQINGIIPKKIS